MLNGKSIVVIGARETEKFFAAASATADVRVHALVAHWAMILKTRIMARASGRPGPNAPTGDYRRSWGIEIVKQGTKWVAVVGTSKPQGRRLEYGFTGTDAIGRTYDQPPYPHVRPAADETEGEFYAAVRKAALA